MSRIIDSRAWYVLLALMWVCVTVLPARADFENRDARIINFEWSYQVIPQNIPYNIAAMQDAPFGGLVTDLVKNLPNDLNKSDILSWNAWGPQLVNPADYAQSVNALSTMSWGKYDGVYLRMNVTPGGLDMFDDHSVAMANSQWLSSVTRQANLHGILFDPEFYSQESKVFHYASWERISPHGG
ncbi:MAG: hypothetical protein IT446_10090 [Phycisphaerales bacterium]|nr:hypothetical protein [Phycisphaerales bacterium]